MSVTTAACVLRVNPFSTRFTRPGAIVPLDDEGVPLDLDSLLARLATLGGSGSIEGLHGRGKTTALLALADHAARHGLAVAVLRVRSVRDLAEACRSLIRLPPEGTLFVDGWESLGRVPGLLIRLLVGLRACHLVVTSHGPAGLPVLIRCRTSPRLLRMILTHLPASAATLDAQDVDAAFFRHQGNLRESLYDLYDRFERCTRSCGMG
jgi:hypothetical protein